MLQGNVILTDANYEILTLLRSHRDDDKGLAFMARHAYPIHSIRLRSPLQRPQLDAALAAADDKQTLRGEGHLHKPIWEGQAVSCLPSWHVASRPTACLSI